MRFNNWLEQGQMKSAPGKAGASGDLLVCMTKSKWGSVGVHDKKQVGIYWCA